jgi:hypothetical protein
VSYVDGVGLGWDGVSLGPSLKGSGSTCERETTVSSLTTVNLSGLWLTTLSFPPGLGACWPKDAFLSGF